MRETQILRGLHKARAANHFADGMVPMVPMGPSPLLSLRRGAVNLKGPGTTTSDSIPAHLSKGESVLPAKTTAALGPENIARAIKATTGKAPARGLRSGGRHREGVIPGMEVTEHFDNTRVPTLDEARARLATQPAPEIGNTFKAAATSTAPPVVEAPKPAGLWNQAKYYGGKAGGVLKTGADSAAQPARVAAAGLSGAMSGAAGAVGGSELAQAARNIGNPDSSGSVGTYTPPAAALQIPTDGYPAAPTKQPYNFFTDNETGRNVGNLMSAASMIPGVGPTARAATGLGRGAISGAVRTAERPLMAGAVQGAANNISNGRASPEGLAAGQASQAPPVAATAQPAAPASLALSQPQQSAPINVERQPNGVMSFSNTADTGQNTYTGPGAAGLRRGNMNVMPAFNGGNNAGAPSDADLAVMRANLRDGVDLQRGTSQARTQANDPQSLLMGQIQRGLGSGQTLTAAGVAALQGLNTTDKNYKASMYGSDVSRDNSLRGNQVTREGNELQYQGGLNRLKFDMQQKGLDRGVEGAKAMDDLIKNDPNTYVPGKDGGPAQYDPQKGASLSKYLAETVPGIDDGHGNTMPLQQAMALNNPAARDAVQKASNEFALREFANQYSKGAPLGKGTGTGRLVVKSAPRASELADLAKNMHATDYIATKLPWINSQTVEIGGLGGKSIAVPLKDIIADPNGRAMLEALNRMPVSN